LIVIVERAVAFNREEVLRAVLFLRHPKTIEIGDAIVQAAGADDRGLVLDHDWAGEKRLEPESATCRDIDIERAVFGDDFSRLFQLRNPSIKPGAKIVPQKNFAHAETGIGRLNRRRV